MDNLIAVVQLVFPLIFTSNLLMSAVKVIAQGSIGNAGLRCILAGIAVFGIIVASALTGDPVNFDSVMSLMKLAGDAAIVAFGAHASFKVISNT